MKNNKPMFENVLQYGDLYSECVLYTVRDTVLCASLINNHGSRFIAMSTDNHGTDWIIADTTVQEIILLIRGRLSLSNLFKNARNIIRSNEYISCGYELIEFDNLDDDEKPNEDSIMDLHGKEYNEYIKSLHDEKTIKIQVKKHGSTLKYTLYEVIKCNKYSFRDYLYNDGFPIIIAVCGNHAVFTGKEHTYQEDSDVKVFEVSEFIGFIKDDLDYEDDFDRFELEIVD